MIVLYAGMIGAGKTGIAVGRAVERARKRNSVIASNIKLTPPEDVEWIHLPVGEYGVDVDTILGIRDMASEQGRSVILLLDEVGIVMDNRFWAKAPPEVKWFLKMSRHLHVDVFATTHDPEEVDVSFRRLVSWTYTISRVPGAKEDGDDGMPWALIARRWHSVDIHKRGRQMGFPSVVVWRREWATWYNSDELITLPRSFTSARSLSPAGSLY